MNLSEEQRIEYGRLALEHGWEWEPGYQGFDPERGGFAMRVPIIGTGVLPWAVFNFCDTRTLLPDFNHRPTTWGMVDLFRAKYPAYNPEIYFPENGGVNLRLWENGFSRQGFTGACKVEAVLEALGYFRDNPNEVIRK